MRTCRYHFGDHRSQTLLPFLLFFVSRQKEEWWSKKFFPRGCLSLSRSLRQTKALPRDRNTDDVLSSHSNAFVSIAEKRQRRVRLSSKISARVCSNSLSTDPKFVRKFLFFPLSFILQLSAHNFHRGLARANRRRAARSFQTQHTPGEDDDDEAEERRERICRDCLLLLPLYERVLLSFSLKMCCLLCVMTSNTILIFYR